MPEIVIEQATATLKKVNPRKEKHGDKKILAVDLIFQTKIANDALGCFDLDGQSVKAHFWDDEGRPRFPQICGLTFEQKFNYHLIKIGAKEYKDVTISKVSINPLEGGIAEIKFNVQLRPSKQQVGILCDLAEEDIEISVAALQGDLLDAAMKANEEDDPVKQDED